MQYQVQSLKLLKPASISGFVLLPLLSAGVVVLKYT